MSTVNPHSNILHVCITGSTNCAVETAHDMCRLTVSHGSFRNDGLTGYHSPAMEAIRKSGAEWIFFDWWTGSWSDDALLIQIGTQLRENPRINGALFDEPLEGNGVFAFADSGFSYDYYGNIPSCILLRRDILEMLLTHVCTLFPYPVQKLADAAWKNGVELQRIHALIPKNPAVQEHLIVPANRRTVLRGKHGEKKKLLVITHELSWTGAPIVLAEACIDVLKPAGYDIMVLSPTAGPLSEKLLQNGISVMTLPEITSPDSKFLYGMAQLYDAVIVNTIVPYEAIRILNTLDKPVLWWIHECQLIYQWIGELLPRQLGNHIHVRCVGQYALGVLKQYRPDYPAQVMVYGLRDQNTGKEIRTSTQGKRFRFATIGSIEHRKGQDILCEAISLLDDDIRKQSEFIFAGKALSSDILASLQALEERYPGHIRYLGLVARDTLTAVYADVDCIVCPSRDDPMPTYVTEGLMYGKPAICSENTGSAAIVRKENAGLIYTDNDPRKLANAITEYVSLSTEDREFYSEKARACFENNFTLEVFRKNLLQTLEELLPPAAE